MKTSESPRWDIQRYFDEGDEDWEDVEETHFLSGYKPSRGQDWDLYLIKEGADYEYILAVREEDGEWLADYELVQDVNSESVDQLQAGLAMAKENGLIRDSNPRDVVDGDVDDSRSALPESDPQDRKRLIRGQSLNLGGTRVQHQNFQLFYIPRFTRADGGVSGARVYAVTADSDVYKWNEDGSIPSGSTRRDTALREAIRRAVEQGFEFRLNSGMQEALFSQDIPAGNVPSIAPSLPVDAPVPSQFRSTSTLATGSQMTDSTKKPSTSTLADSTKKTPRKFTHVTTAPSTDEQIHIPDGMSYAQARTWLTQIEQAEEQLVQWDVTIDAYPLDGAIALRRVLDNRFGGAVKAGATQATFFGEREVPPYMVEVEIGVGQTTHVPWGHFTIPLMPEHKIHAGISYKEKQLYFRLRGEIKRKYKETMDGIAEQVRAELRNASIYKSKAFRVNFPTEEEMRDESYSPHDYAPKFIDVAAPSDNLILSKSVMSQVETSLFAPVLYTKQCLTLGIPLKRGVLLEGKYGTGKTLTASMLSRLCTQNGWTFIYVKQVRDLEKAMRFAKRYEPAVVFAEDIDTVLESKEGQKRDQAMNDILNTIDGVDMKNTQQIVVLTTNHVDRINRAMLRPGRLDAVISILPPDAEAVTRLMRHYARGLLDHASDTDLQASADLLQGQIPAIVTEVVKRAKMEAVFRVGQSGQNSDKVTLEGSDILRAAQGMLAHIELLKEPAADNRSDVEKAAATLVAGLRPQVSEPQQRTVQTVPVVTGTNANAQV